MRRLLALALVALALGGCANGYTLVSGERTKVGNALSVAPDGAWNKQTQGHTEVWTLDGPAVQQVRFMVGIEDGEQIAPQTPAQSSNSETQAPKFHANMTPFEVAELVTATLAQANVTNMATKGLKPAKFGTDEGFSFELSYTSSSGLECLGYAVGRIKDKKLYLVLYIAPKLYFFERDRARVEHMIASLRFEA